MKGIIPIDIPTKKYIKAYVYSKLGTRPCLTLNSHDIGNKLHDVLQRSTNERRTSFKRATYSTTMRIYLPVNTFRRLGHNLNETNVKSFNLYIEKEVKHYFYQLMDDFQEVLPNFRSNLPEVRRKLGIKSDAWSEDSMRKDYYRRRKNSMPASL